MVFSVAEQTVACEGGQLEFRVEPDNTHRVLLRLISPDGSWIAFTFQRNGTLLGIDRWEAEVPDEKLTIVPEKAAQEQRDFAALPDPYV